MQKGLPLRSLNGGASAVVILAALAISVSPASARDGEKRDSVAQDAVDAVASPLTDLNIVSRDIPPTLQLAQIEPYRLEGLAECPALWDEIEALDAVLGPDADAPADKDGIVNKGLKTGGSFLSGFIPFRGIVRRVSGAKAEEDRFEAAVYAGVARRSFLKGVAQGRECSAPVDDPIEDAHDLLGIELGS